jgi:hypothetical protein
VLATSNRRLSCWGKARLSVGAFHRRRVRRAGRLARGPSSLASCATRTGTNVGALCCAPLSSRRQRYIRLAQTSAPRAISERTQARVRPASDHRRPTPRLPRRSQLSARMDTRSQDASIPRPEAVEHTRPQSSLTPRPSTSCGYRIAWRNAARSDLARCVL